ncbi:hypothetical protein EVAR_49643_1 [Eumeta japonica]|uniref:Uncharacterized protein n=1 Tax=Eumeta variegata TaxID=151549 RepID=A0A4C1Y843_EUMVA|nr:hypothetical protein EVAR_49643_1 [Eumeta japonica]
MRRGRFGRDDEIEVVPEKTPRTPPHLLLSEPMSLAGDITITTRVRPAVCYNRRVFSSRRRPRADGPRTFSFSVARRSRDSVAGRAISSVEVWP